MDELQTNKDSPSSSQSAQRFKKRWIFFGLLVCAYLPQLPGCVGAHEAKFGRVVGIDGKGIPNAFIIVRSTVYSSGGSPFLPDVYSSERPEYDRLTKTDANGWYWIPSAWLDLDGDHFLPIFGAFQQHWSLVAIDPGFVDTLDEKKWKKGYSNVDYGSSPYAAGSGEWRPFALQFGFVARVGDIELKHIEMTLPQALQYYGRIALTRENEGVELRTAFYRYFLPKMCGFPQDKELDATPRYSPVYAPSYKAFWQALRELEPVGFRHGSLVWDGIYKFTPKMICDAMLQSGVGAQ